MLLILVIFSIALPAMLSFASDGTFIADGDISFWWNIYEENENGIQQEVTKEPGSDTTSGFNIKQARLSFGYKDGIYPLEARFQIRFEERVAMLDFYGAWHPSSLFNLYAGQMKIPSTYESLAPDTSLDFASRSSLSKNIADWSLSRAPYYSALYGTRTDSRDAGIGIKGSFGDDKVSYFLMVSNGLGANLFVGGKESKEFIYCNDFGDYLYGARLDVSPAKYLKFGGHYSLNRHKNMIYNDQKTVFDIDRYSWSADLQAKTPYAYLTVLYGAGAVNDDFFRVSSSNLEYSGWEAKVLSSLIAKRIQLGLRYDLYDEKFLGGDLPTKQKNLTLGINVKPASNARLQLNYIIKKTESETKPDLDDNILMLNFQYYFSHTNH